METKLNIRLAQIQDANSIRELYRPYVEETLFTLDTFLPSVSEIEKQILDFQATHAFLVAELNEKLVAFAYARPFSLRQAYQYTVEVFLYTDRNHPNLAIKQQLYQELETSLSQKKIVALISTMTHHHQSGIQFYEKNGFTQRGILPNAGIKFNEWLDIIWLTKELNAPERLSK
ncbi:N-acetyltransferase family protein [Facklamia sp. DSM 111018]|uniref:N-acetyltransferase family protein n=1 Tax=Facklamia lactis TaxID=2749967 RepID=A0ABS0LMG8_9LACT|nr:GNAT family N-acetyltransferase [Facklamia lactis]MBG9985360.1 N-acetyltransferase family protein [Facklamia lactis]